MPKTLDLLYTAEVAEILGVHIRTVARMAESGRLKAVQRPEGRATAWVFARSDVEALRETEVADLRARLNKLQQAAAS